MVSAIEAREDLTGGVGSGGSITNVELAAGLGKACDVVSWNILLASLSLLSKPIMTVAVTKGAYWTVDSISGVGDLG